MLHALDLDEIRLVIGAFLTRPALLACCRVSRDWCASFSPLLWEHIDLTDFRRLPPTDQVLAHASLIRSLRYNTLVPADFFPLVHYQRLACLGVHSPKRSFWDQTTLVTLIRNHAPSLKRLDLCLRNAPPSLDLYHAIGSCSTLTTLWLLDVSIPSLFFPALMQACSRGIVALRLQQVQIADRRFFGELELEHSTLFPVPKDKGKPVYEPLYRLQDLHIQAMHGISIQDQIQLMKLCPNLKSLYWRGTHTRFNDYFPVEWFNQVLETGIWPHLSTLDVMGWGFNDVHLAATISLLPGISFDRLLVSRTGFGPLSLDALVRSEVYLLITILELHGCDEVSSPMIQRMLCMMPELRYFSADRLNVEDMFETFPWSTDETIDDATTGDTLETTTAIAFAPSSSPPSPPPTMSRPPSPSGPTTLAINPWACHRLRTLKLSLNMEMGVKPDSMEYSMVQHHVFGQIGALDKLETLELARRLWGDGEAAWLSKPEKSEVRQLQYRLGAGLYQWKSMRRLCALLFRPGQIIGVREVDWMIETWPDLRYLSACLHTDRDITYILAKRLARAGIICI